MNDIQHHYDYILCEIANLALHARAMMRNVNSGSVEERAQLNSVDEIKLQAGHVYFFFRLKSIYQHFV
jgi:hypothetical protein